ncbi:hypothetical protein, partial [Mycobacterium tuberculosis]
VRGTMHFDNHAVAAEALAGELFGSRITAALKQEDDGVLRLRGGFEFVPDAAGAGASRLLPVFLRKGLEGPSQWQAVVALSGQETGRLRMESNL